MAQGLQRVNLGLLNVHVNVRNRNCKRLTVQIMNPEMMHETKKFSADDGKQSETEKQFHSSAAATGNARSLSKYIILS